MTDALDPAKQIKYAKHAFARVIHREFVGEMVYEVIYDPDWEYAATIPGGVVLVKSMDGFDLHVVYLEFPEYYLICSVFEDDEKAGRLPDGSIR